MCSKRKKIIIGVTGGFGTGKTTVAKMFKALGAVVLDADKMAHKTFKKDTSSYERIVKVFGRDILDKSGKIDRAKLADLAFRNRSSLKKLCNIVHPAVIGRIKESISKVRRAPAIVIDAPLLIEAGLHKIVDYLVVVKTARSTQIKRVKKKTGLASDEIIRRIKNQMPLGKKAKMADYVINNEGGLDKTNRIVRTVWRKMNRGRYHLFKRENR